VSERLPKYLETGTQADVQVLTPMKKSDLGAVNLNKLLQERINPPSPGKNEREFRSAVFREGDKVMQISNNYSASWRVFDKNGRAADEGEGVFNGDCGRIASIDEENECITVLFDDGRRVDYDFSRLDELELAYAVTIHKSQGSEYRAVVIPLLGGPPMLFSRNLLYTAVTRARELAVIVGMPETVRRMVDNNREVNRCTSLSRRLRSYRF
jgi:exodeoxyribonuclease V alpha subunit